MLSFNSSLPDNKILLPYRIKYSTVHILINLFIFASYPSILNSQTPGSTDFLIYPPSPVAQAMGGAGVALPTDDAFGMYFNPAILGISAKENNISANFYPVKHKFNQLNSKSFSEITSQDFAINAGMNLKTITGGLPLSVGIGFINQNMNFDKLTGWLDPEFSTIRFPTKSYANTFSVAASLDLGVKLGLGISIKSISSDLTLISSINTTGDTSFSNTSATAFDIGMIAVFPILKEKK
jgi:hypothetical protein